ncbi:hypothetical protein PMAYCL1PPCAC_04942, partial [Pristionchus mayeri]
GSESTRAEWRGKRSLPPPPRSIDSLLGTHGRDHRVGGGEAIEREEQFDAKFLDEKDVVTGETRVQTGEDPEKWAIATMATAKNEQSIAS